MFREFQINPTDRQAVNALFTFIEGLNFELNVTVAPYSVKRSSQQNRLFHGVIIPAISNYIGESNEFVKEYLKREFLNTEIKEFRGKKIEVVQSTADLSTNEFAEFCEKCVIWAKTELNIDIKI